jgi:hypothetical protein
VEKMSEEILVRYTGSFDDPGFKVILDGDYFQIAVRDANNNIKVIFTGKNFSQKKYKEQAGQEKEELYLRQTAILYEL